MFFEFHKDPFRNTKDIIKDLIANGEIMSQHESKLFRYVFNFMRNSLGQNLSLRSISDFDENSDIAVI